MECWEVRITFENYFSTGIWIFLHDKLNVSLLCFSCTRLCVAPVLLIPATCEKITVCVEDDEDLRVDCLVEPKENKINSYEFSWSSGSKETLINTNVSGSSAENEFKAKSSVEELSPHGYRMTLKGFKDKLPHNTTYMCKISGNVASVSIEKGRWTVWLCGCGFEGVSIRINEWVTINCVHPTLSTTLSTTLCRSSCPVFSCQRVSAELLLLDRLSAALLLSNTQLNNQACADSNTHTHMHITMPSTNTIIL